MKTLIAIPCLNMVHTDFMTSMLNLRKTKDTSYATSINCLIYDSRNGFAASAITNGYDRVLWLDSDMVFQPDLLERLSADMDETGSEYVSALYFTRRLPTKPVVYSRIDYEPGGDGIPAKAHAEPYWDYPKDTMFLCAGTGFGAVMTSTNLLKRIWDKYGEPFNPLPHMGEDLSFCYRAGQMGYYLFCDSRVKVGHIGGMIFDEQTYTAQNKQPERAVTGSP